MGGDETILEMDTGDGIAQHMNILNTTEEDLRVLKMVCFSYRYCQGPQTHNAAIASIGKRFSSERQDTHFCFLFCFVFTEDCLILIF